MDKGAGFKRGVRLLRSSAGASNLVRMKNLKSLQLVALAGVAAALTGCSSTDSAMNDGSHDAYRWVSAGGWVPITDAQRMVAFPPGWVPGNFGPVSYETYRLAPPTDGDYDADLSVASRADADVDADVDVDASGRAGTTVVSADVDADADSDTFVNASSNTTFREDLQPGDTFVEAAGADSEGDRQVRRIILYTPFNSTGVGR